MKHDKKKLLILGFSVTEQIGVVGYAPLVANYLRRRLADVEVDIRGIGGIHVSGLAYEFDNYVSMTRYDACILDITSSNYRTGKTSPQDFAWAVAAVLAKARARGAPTAMVHLWRSDVKFDDDMFIDVCDHIGHLMNVRSVNIGKVVAALPEEERSAMFKDEVHPTGTGATFYCETIGPLALDLLQQTRSELDPTLEEFAATTFSWPAAELTTAHRQRIYRRSGLILTALQIYEGERVTLKLPRSCVLGGVSCLVGPQTGVFEIKLDSRAAFKLLSYDTFAYYERLCTRILTESWTLSFEIEQLSGVPDISLRKGSQNNGPRIGELFNILASTSPRKELAARARQLLDR